MDLSNANYSVNFSRLCLSIVGVWPNLKRTRQHTITSNFVFTLIILVIVYFVLIPQLTKLFLGNNNLDMIIDILCTAIIPISVALIKMTFLRYDTQVIKSLLLTIFEDWRSIQTLKQKSIMCENARMGRKIALACVSLAYGTSNVFLVLRLMLIHANQVKTGIRSLPFESHFIVDVSNSPWFEITWFMQGVCSFAATTAYSGIDGFFAVLVLHLCGQLATLNNELIELNVEESKNDVGKKIAKIAERHSELYTFGKTIEAAFNRMFLIQILACLIQFCLQGYQIVSIVMDKTVEHPELQLIFMSMFICYMTLDLYIYCYVAEKLRTESIDIAKSAYHCKWYNFKPKDAYNLIFIMKRAQYPLEITAGKFCALSLSLFASIGKTSMAYLSVLLAVKEEKK